MGDSGWASLWYVCVSTAILIPLAHFWSTSSKETPQWNAANCCSQRKKKNAQANQLDKRKVRIVKHCVWLVHLLQTAVSLVNRQIKPQGCSLYFYRYWIQNLFHFSKMWMQIFVLPKHHWGFAPPSIYFLFIWYIHRVGIIKMWHRINLNNIYLRWCVLLGASTVE